MSRSNGSKVLQRVEMNVNSLYIFNSNFGKTEGTEENKILYYYPDRNPVNMKMNQIGLSEAIIAFTGNFIDEKECKALHTQKTTQIFYQPEKDFWMIMVLDVPKEIRSKDNDEIEDYRIGGEVNDHIYFAVLQQSYNLYRLFNGTFTLGAQDKNLLNQRLKDFFDSFIQKLKLPINQFSDFTNSVQYLPLEKSLFLRAHNLMNITLATFRNIKDIIFLINGEIVCSGDVNPYDLYSLHGYINDEIMIKLNPIHENSGVSNNPIEESQNASFIKLDKKHIYLQRGSAGIKKFWLVIYKVMDATLCLIIGGDEELQNEFYEDFQSFIKPQLTCLTKDIKTILECPSAKHTIPSTSSNQSNNIHPKYLFINQQNLKHLTNIPNQVLRPKTGVSGITTNVLNLIADLRWDVNKDENTSNGRVSEEIQIKTTNDLWIVKRRCNWREYFVIIFNSKATLLDINLEAKRIFEKELKETVFFDK